MDNPEHADRTKDEARLSQKPETENKMARGEECTTADGRHGYMIGVGDEAVCVPDEEI